MSNIYATPLAEDKKNHVLQEYPSPVLALQRFPVTIDCVSVEGTQRITTPVPSVAPISRVVVLSVSVTTEDAAALPAKR